MSVAKEIAMSRRDLPSFSPDVFVIDPDFNARLDYGNLDEIARSIAAKGYDPSFPLKGYLAEDKKHIVLVDGHRRIKAIRENLSKYTDTPLKSVPCILEEKGVSKEDRIVTMFRAGSGKPLTDVEKAACIKRLIDFGWTITDVSNAIGKSTTQTSQLLDLNSASTALKKAIAAQVISTTAAVKLLKAPAAKQAAFSEKLLAMMSDPVNAKRKSIVKVKDVEKAVQNHANNISARDIKDTMGHVDKFIEAGKNAKTWRAVRYGLALALGEVELDPDFNL